MHRGLAVASCLARCPCHCCDRCRPARCGCRRPLVIRRYRCVNCGCRRRPWNRHQMTCLHHRRLKRGCPRHRRRKNCFHLDYPMRDRRLMTCRLRRHHRATTKRRRRCLPCSLRHHPRHSHPCLRHLHHCRHRCRPCLRTPAASTRSCRRSTPSRLQRSRHESPIVCVSSTWTRQPPAAHGPTTLLRASGGQANTIRAHPFYVRRHRSPAPHSGGFPCLHLGTPLPPP